MLGEKTEVLISVKIETIRCQGRIFIYKLNIMTHTGKIDITVIVEIVTIQKECITLLHAYITECLKSILLLEVMRAVTIHIHTVSAETYITDQYPCIGIYSLVETCDIGMQHVDKAL